MHISSQSPVFADTVELYLLFNSFELTIFMCIVIAVSEDKDIGFPAIL